MCDCFVYRVDEHSRVVDAAGDMAVFVRDLRARQDAGVEDLTDETANDLIRIMEKIGER